MNWKDRILLFYLAHTRIYFLYKYTFCDYFDSYSEFEESFENYTLNEINKSKATYIFIDTILYYMWTMFVIYVFK